jgi:hypothetical protein
VRTAHAYTDWADMIVIWETTPLHHKVSRQFTNDPNATDKIIRVHRRGIEALATTISHSLAGTSLTSTATA